MINCCVTSPPYYGLRDYGVDRQIGLEESPKAYINNLVSVFHEVKRVLKDDGTLWVNIGDSYYNAGNELKPKDMIGIPWMLAFALREDGWYLRQDIIWHKPNPMPESVKDRCTKSHEYIFLLSKNKNYYFDSESISEPVAERTIERCSQNIENQQGSLIEAGVYQKTMKACLPRFGGNKYGNNADENYRIYSGNEYNPYKNLADKGQQPNSIHIRRAEGEKDIEYPRRNKRDVWSVTTKPYKEAHFAVYPEELIEPCILAGSPRYGVILDPFNGSGTTGVSALKNDRNYIGIELNPDYVCIAENRIQEVMKQINWKKDQYSLFEEGE